MGLPDYLKQLSLFAAEAKTSDTANELLEIYDKTEEILDHPQVRSLRPEDRDQVYGKAREVYKAVIGSLTLRAKQGEAEEERLRRLVRGHIGNPSNLISK